MALVVVASSAWLRAEEALVTLIASVDRSEVAIGEPIRYVLTLRHPQGVEVAWPSFGSTIGGFAIEDSGSQPPKTVGGLVVEERWYRLTGYTTGSQTIPEPVATSRTAGGADHEVRGQAIAITVKSLLPQDWESQDIRDAKPPVPIRSGGWRWIIGGLVLLGGAAGTWWLKRRRIATSRPTAPPRPAHEIALEELERLRRDELPSTHRYEAYYVRLSHIVRTYIEGRFGLRAPEMTTEEFLQAALQGQGLPAAHRLLLQDFLMRCDLVKFARYEPSAGEAEAAFEAARRFVLDTAPSEAPVHINFASRNLLTGRATPQKEEWKQEP